MAPAAQPVASSAKPNPKVLRLGLIKEGKVSERITKIGEVVGVGENLRNLFVVTGTKLGQRVEMFIPQREGYLLQVPEWVEGMIQTKDGMKSLVDLRSKAQRKGDLWVYLLDERMRGKLVIGNNSILFQFVPAPPQPERVMSAADFRAKFYDDEDPLFLALLGTFSIAATVFLAWVALSPRPDDADLVDLEKVLRLLDKDIKPIELPPPEVVEAEGEKPAEVEKEKPAEKADTPASPAPNKAQPSAAETVASRSLLIQALGTTGISASGDTAVDILGDQATMAGLDNALRGVTGVEQANASNVGTVRAGGAGGRGEATVGVSTATGGAVSGGDAVVVRVKKPMVDAGDVDAEFESGDAGGIKSVVNKRKGTFESCTQTALKQSPELKGRVSIGWTIAAGKVSNVHTVSNTTNDAALATCFATVVRGLRFEESVSGDIAAYTWSVSGS